MNIHQNARLTPQGRLLLVERITEAGWSVVQAAQGRGDLGAAELPVAGALSR
jgi:leucine-zipper of insertion element IS481